MHSVVKTIIRLHILSRIDVRKKYEGIFSSICSKFYIKEQCLSTQNLHGSMKFFRKPVFGARMNSKNKVLFYDSTKHFYTSPVLGDYYKTLGVPRTATKNEIKLAYLKLAKKTHPDANPGDVNAKETFQKIAEAYTVLSDDNQRQQYDNYGFSPGQYHRQNPYGSGFTPPPNMNPYDVFKQVFEEIGIQEFIKNVERTKEEAIFAVNAAGKGDWVPAKNFASLSNFQIRFFF